MARQLIVAFIAGAILAAAMFWLLRPASPSEEARQALAIWLASDCASGFDAPSLERLRKEAGSVEGLLKQVFEKGPSPDELVKAEASARMTYRQIRVRLRSGIPSGLPESQTPPLLAQSEDAFVQQAREDFIGRRRSAALALARTVGKGDHLVKQVNADSRSPFRDEVRVAPLAKDAKPLQPNPKP